MKKRILSVTALFVSLSASALFSAADNTPMGAPQIVFNTMDSGTIVGLELSLDGSVLYSADQYGNTVKSWDTESGRLLHTWTGFKSPQKTILSPDGKKLLVIGGKAALINLESGSDISNLPQKFYAAAFSPDGKNIVIGQPTPQKTAAVYSLELGIEILALKANSFIYALAYSPDGKSIAASCFDRKIHLFDATTGDETAVLPELPMISNAILFSSDGKMLVYSCADKTLTVWNIKDQEKEYELKDFSAEPKTIRFSPDGNLMAVGADRKMRLIKSRNGKTVFDFKNPKSAYSIGDSAVFTSDGKRLYTASFGISCWDINDEKELNKVGGDYAAFCNAVAFSPDRKRIALAADRALKIIDMETGEFITSANMPDSIVASSLVFSEDGTKIIVRYSGGLRIYHTDSLSLVSETPFDKSSIPVVYGGMSRTALSPKYMVTLYNNGNRLTSYDLQSGMAEKSADFNYQLTSLTLSSDSRIIAAHDNTNSLRLFNTATLKETAKIKLKGFVNTQHLAISHNGKFLAMGTSSEIVVYSIPSLRQIKSIKIGDVPVSQIGFTDDDRTMIAGKNDGSIFLWNTSTWKEKTVLSGHTNSVIDIAVSHDGKLLVSGSNDKFFKFWDITKGECIASLVYSTAYTTVNGQPVLVKDFVVASPDGRYDGTEWGLTRLHWVVGNEVIPLKDFGSSFNAPGLLGQILSKHIVKPPVDATKRLFGKIRSVSGNEIVVSYSGARTIAQAKEKFFVILDNGEQAEIEAVFPMMTSMKCRVVKASQRSAVRPGMPVFR
jgi:WD40 repeat protein